MAIFARFKVDPIAAESTIQVDLVRSRGRSEFQSSGETSSMTLKVGDHTPDFTLPSSGGKSVTLSRLYADKTVVLFFYPKDDTIGCTIEACGFRDSYETFVEAGAEVVGISSDSIASHDRFAQKHKLPMTLLSDVDGKVRALFGVKSSLGLMPGRATFVIDRNGVVRHAFVSQLRAGAHVGEALSVVRELTDARS